MSSHFSANQYETAFSSQRLQNYQLPAQHKEHPSLRQGVTKIITNDRGHLTNDSTRSVSSPWGSFVGTWQMERKPVQLKTTTRLQTRYKSAQSNRVSSAPSTRASSRASGVTEALSKTPESDVSKSPPASAASTVKTLDGSSVREQVSPSPSSIASGSRPASGSNGSQQEARGSVRSKTASSVPSVASQVSSEQTVRSRGGSVADGSSRTVTPFQVLSLPQSAASVRSASVASSLPEEDLTIASRSITPSQVASKALETVSQVSGGSRLSTARSEHSTYSVVPLEGEGQAASATPTSSNLP